MFRDALVESSGRLKVRHKYLSSLSVLINGSLLLALILWPLLHPQGLPKQALSTLLIAPAPPTQAATRPTSSAHSLSKTEPMTNLFPAPDRIQRLSSGTAVAPAPDFGAFLSYISNDGSSKNGNMGDVMNSLGKAASPTVVTIPQKRVVISTGVMEGNRISGRDPIYPAIAKAVHVQGTVSLQATISEAGAIENLRVLSGPAMLQAAAIDQVKTWRYKPYLLNGRPVEVETTINVVFNLGN